MKFKSLTMLLILGLTLTFQVNAQDDENEGKSGYEFTIVKELPATPVKNQYRSGTCWSFSSLSFLESELLRMGKGEYDLSEMFVVRNAYNEKAQKYVRFHGNFSFSGGGAFHDVIHVLKNYGMVPEEAYTGKVIGEENHVHGELDEVTRAFVDAVIKNKNKKLTPVWDQAFNGILDAYLGDYPSTFIYEGKEYTPRSFADELGLNPDDYVEIGSYMHHPYHEKFILEVPDNWMLDEINNVTLDEMMEIIDNAIDKGYTVAWGADVSEKGFSWKNGIAVVPNEEVTDLAGTEKEKWEKLTEKEKLKAIYSFDQPVEEVEVTPEMRQQQFDNYQSTDDHGMQITGIAVDQNGDRFYKVKNSWGVGDQIYDGYFYASVPYVKLKTIDIMVNKNAIPAKIRKELGL